MIFLRIDKELVRNGSFSSREKAQDAILKGLVLVNGSSVKASYEVKETDQITIDNLAYKFVSRGGYKLEKAIEFFNLDFKDKIVVDIGASTGGFTDCSLKHGAKMVYAIDVGTLQLDPSLKENPKVISMEQTNFLEVNESFNNDFFVMDVSFISITKLLSKIASMMNDEMTLVTLIKPQFEAGGIHFKNGVLNDMKKHEAILDSLFVFFERAGLILRGITYSPIQGKSGNIEYLACLKKQGKTLSVDIKRLVKEAFMGVKEC